MLIDGKQAELGEKSIKLSYTQGIFYLNKKIQKER